MNTPMLIEIPAFDDGLPRPASPQREKFLKERLGRARQPSPEKCIERVERAVWKRQRLIQATKEAAATKNRRAKQVAVSTKEKRAVSSAHMMAALEARLEAAAERRKAISRGSTPPASPASQPAASPKQTFEPLALSLHPSLACPPPPAPSRDPSFAPTADVASAPPSLPEPDDGLALLGQLNGCTDADSVQEWVKARETIAMAGRWLGERGVEAKHARKMLALAYMACQPQDFFDGSQNDSIMQREAKRFDSKLRHALEGLGLEGFAAAFTRARRFYAAWAAQDVPKQAAQVDAVLGRLHEALMGIRAQQARENAPLAPPEDILTQIRLLGGAEAEAAARQQYAQPWQEVRGEDLAARVREAATRAFWDAVAAQVNEGQYAALFDVLRELQQAMRALLAHSPARVEELEDKFDAAWIEQQASSGVLATEQVHALMSFVASTIASWQAPADEAATAAWAGAVDEMISRTRGMELVPFITEYLLHFLRGAIDRVGQVYQRLMAMAPQDQVEEAVSDAMSAQD